jgi:hypothetical protein
MLKRVTEELGLAIAPGCVTLVRTRGKGRGVSTIVGQWQGDTQNFAQAHLVDQVRRVLEKAGVSELPVRVVLADVLTRFWTVDPPLNARQLHDCEAATLMRFTKVFGDNPSQWQICADYDAAQPFLACAIKLEFLELLSQKLHERKLKLLSMEPECVALWNHWRKSLASNAWLGICGPQWLTLGIVVAGRMQSTRRLATGSNDPLDAAWLVAAVQREAARMNVPVPAALGICGKVPTTWLGQHRVGIHCSALGAVCNAQSLFGVQL